MPERALAGEELRRELQPKAGVDVEIDVLSPVMASRVRDRRGAHGRREAGVGRLDCARRVKRVSHRLQRGTRVAGQSRASTKDPRSSRLEGSPLRRPMDLPVARRRANAVRRLAPAFVSPQAFRAATLAASGYGGERQSRRECRLGDKGAATAVDEASAGNIPEEELSGSPPTTASGRSLARTWQAPGSS